MRVAQLSILLALLVGCDSMPEDEARFQELVAPVLQSRCAALVCHGVTDAQVADGVTLPAGSFVLNVDSAGTLSDWQQARTAMNRVINTVEAPEFSSVLRKPLSATWGGLAHQGGDNFVSPRDSAYLAVREWILEQPEGGEDPSDSLNAGQQFFSQSVQPQLIGRGCALANCHGPDAFIPFRLQPGLSIAGELRFSHEMTLANYSQVLPFLSLSGDPMQGRVIRKSLPIGEGGILHRGGNRSFFSATGDPAVEALVEWTHRERLAVVGDVPTEPRGIVFVRGPVQAGELSNPAAFVGGRDIILNRGMKEGEPEVNLTAEHHDGAADIRDPDGSPEADHIVFSMRRTEGDAHRIYELSLISGELRALTDGAVRTRSGEVVADLWPCYGPDGFVYFSSNRHDVAAERYDGLDFDLYRVARKGGEVERLSYTPAPETEPAFFRVGALQDYIVFSYRRAVDGRDKTVGFSMPVDFHVDYHIYFGITPEANLFHQFEETPDGRSVVVLGDIANAWSAGQLAFVDRNMGPDFPAGLDDGSPSLPAFAETLRVLTEGTKSSGVSPDSVYRDPVAMPDGSILVSHAAGPFDLSDPAASPDFDISRVVMTETGPVCGARGCQSTHFQEIEPLATRVGVSEFDPEPLFVWPSRGEAHSALDPAAPTLFSMSDVTVNDGIMKDLAPIGKSFRDDVRYLRFVEAVPGSPLDWRPEAIAFDGVQPTTRGSHMPARILAEVELAADGSLFAEIPPNTPFRTQLLNADRMSVGVQHNRWLFGWPGQHFKQSSPRGLYDQLCGGCHGAISGVADDLLGAPELTTRATVTLARYVDSDPRLPSAPLQLGDATRNEVTYGDVDPIIQRACATAGCHVAGQGLDLSNTPTEFFSTAYESLVPAFVDVYGGRARASQLIEIATGRDLDAPGDPTTHPAIELSSDELLTIVRWIEVGAHYRLPGR